MESKAQDSQNNQKDEDKGDAIREARNKSKCARNLFSNAAKMGAARQIAIRRGA